MTRPLRSLLIGDCDFYFSPFIHGVAAACGKLGILHSQINIRATASLIAQRIEDVQPDLIWGHMLLWPPGGAPPVPALLDLCAKARKRGAFVAIHDGDIKEKTRWAQDVSGAVDLALCNHRHDRIQWRVPVMHWPYAAFPQDDLAPPREDWRCEVAFAGQLGRGIYDTRTRLVEGMKGSGLKVWIFDGTPATGGNTLLRTPDLAASATCVLGAGRPEVAGWLDTRVFQYPGAGAILLHDDVGGFLEPWVHYAPYVGGSVASATDAARRVIALSDADQHTMRLRALAHVQARHSYTARVQQVIDARAGREVG
ncbi:MAG: glycosyltransferase [Dehalococcoidia bacterium]|nr:glycosyltransferase [Dehalococcoidia bacterium]